MGWLSIPASLRAQLAPDFLLADAKGRMVARSHYRDRCSLLLFFLDPSDCNDAAGAIRLVESRKAGWAEIGGRAFVILAERDASGLAGYDEVIFDTDGVVTARYADLIGARNNRCFLIVLDRYGAPHAAFDGSPFQVDFGERLQQELTALYYDCPE